LRAKLEARHGRAEQQSSAAAPTQEDAEEVDAAEEARRHAKEDRRRREKRADREKAAAESSGFLTAREVEMRTSGARQGGGTEAPRGRSAQEQEQFNQRERARVKRQWTEGDMEPIAQGTSGAIARPPPPGAGTRAPLQGVARSSNEVARSRSEVAQGSGQATFIPLAPIMQPQQVAQGAAQGSAQPIVITGGQLAQHYATSYMSWHDEENARRTHAQQVALQRAQQLATERAAFPDIPHGQRSQLAEQPLAQPAIGECCIRNARWGRNGSF
jgi:hypothetical protein